MDFLNGPNCSTTANRQSRSLSFDRENFWETKNHGSSKTRMKVSGEPPTMAANKSVEAEIARREYEQCLQDYRMLLRRKACPGESIVGAHRPGMVINYKSLLQGFAYRQDQRERDDSRPDRTIQPILHKFLALPQ